MLSVSTLFALLREIRLESAMVCIRDLRSSFVGFREQQSCSDKEFEGPH